MRLIQKMLIGTCAVSVAGAMGLAGVAIDGSIEYHDRLDHRTQILADSGYDEANHEYKQAQIEKIVTAYGLGLISERTMEHKCKEENLSALDVEEFAQNNLSKEEYDEYKKLTLEIYQARTKSENFVASSIMMLLVAISMVMTFMAIEPEEKI